MELLHATKTARDMPLQYEVSATKKALLNNAAKKRRKVHTTHLLKGRLGGVLCKGKEGSVCADVVAIAFVLCLDGF